MSSLVGMLNHPTIKRYVKEIIGGATCGAGVAATFLYEREVCKKRTDPELSTMDKVVIGCSRVSLVLSAAVTPLGVSAISFVVSRIGAADRLEKLFGPNTTFVGNWKHPRHIVSLVAAGLAIPIVVRRCLGRFHRPDDRMLQYWSCWTLVTGRPTLHIVNDLARRLFR